MDYGFLQVGLMWWFGLVVWGGWDIVIFWFPGVLGFLFSPPPFQKGVSGCWSYIVLVQKHPLAPPAPGKALECSTQMWHFLTAYTPLRYGCAVSGCWTHKASLYRNTCWPFYLGKAKTATQGHLWPLNNVPNNVCQVPDRSTSFFRLLGPRFSKNMFKNFKFPDPQTSNPNHHINPCWFLWDLYWFLWCSGEFYWFLFFFLVSGEFFGFLWFSEEFLWVSGELSWICGFYGFVRQGAGSENMSLV